MAVEKGKVIAVLETRYKGKLTKNFIESIADKWAPKIDTDADVDKYVEDRQDVLDATISEADRRASTAAAKARTDAAAAAGGKKEGDDQDAGQPGPGGNAPAVPDGAPDWFKTFLQGQQQQMQQLTTAITGIQQQHQAETITDRFKKDDRLKGIPEVFFKGRIPSKDEDYEAAVTELVADYTPFAEANKLGTFGKDAPPAGGAGASVAGKVDPDLVAFAQKQSAAVAPAKM